jgi:flagellar M-ring protein FliF
MRWSDYWGALAARQRIGLGAGLALVVATTIGFAVWALHDPYVPLAGNLTPEQMGELAQELDRAKLSYRIADGTSAVEVARSQLGKARAAAADGPSALPPSVGLELFKESDFSSTDFAQKINYQRALQGELTRTIQGITGVRSSRVHVILADGGLFKRDAAKASAAVSVAMQPGKTLARSQVRGIQRLVAAAVPQIRIDDVVVLDESGTGVSRAAGDAESDASTAQLELKRQADQYLESKLLRLLEELVPGGTVSLSVDTLLDYRQLRTTTEEPIAARAATGSEPAAGVLMKERQSQRGRTPAPAQGSADAAETESSDWENEYKVGHRLEQVLSLPGSVRRISVAVALQGAPVDLQGPMVEQLVAHAVGIDRSRGDSVVVLLLPVARSVAASGPLTGPQHLVADEVHRAAPRSVATDLTAIPLLIAALVIFLVASLLWLRSRAGGGLAARAQGEEVEAVAAKVRQWLAGGAPNERA